MKNNAILDFFKSEHFMKRQWETGLDDYHYTQFLERGGIYNWGG